VVILAGVEYQPWLDLATVGIIKLAHAEPHHRPPYSSWELSLKRQDALPI